LLELGQRETAARDTGLVGDDEDETVALGGEPSGDVGHKYEPDRAIRAKRQLSGFVESHQRSNEIKKECLVSGAAFRVTFHQRSLLPQAMLKLLPMTASKFNVSGRSDAIMEAFHEMASLVAQSPAARPAGTSR
jgi:hypothetical protein